MGFKEVLDRASSGDPRAQCALGYIYFKGDGTEVDLDKAFIWFDMAADQGDPEGECNAAYMLVHAIGTNANLEEAIRLYKDSAAKGYVQSQFNLAHMYSDGLGVEQDWDKAIELYTRAFEGGSVPACYRLAVIYEEGRGTEKDESKAASLYRKCSEVGHDRALVRLGIMTFEGRGVRRDPEGASRLFVKAADDGNADAMFWLGMMSLTGEGMFKSVNNARKWLSRAARRGNEEAVRVLESLRSGLDLQFVDSFAIPGTSDESLRQPFPDMSVVTFRFYDATAGEHPDGPEHLADEGRHGPPQPMGGIIRACRTYHSEHPVLLVTDGEEPHGGTLRGVCHYECEGTAIVLDIRGFSAEEHLCRRVLGTEERAGKTRAHPLLPPFGVVQSDNHQSQRTTPPVSDPY